MPRCVFALIIFFIITATGRPQDPVYINFSVEDGLPSSNVFSIHSDSKGNLWFATTNGVGVYDSRIFRKIGIPEGLEDPYILQIKEDTTGRVWFMSRAGGLFYYNGSEVVPHPQNRNIISTLQSAIPTDFLPLSQDSIIMLHWYWSLGVSGKGVTPKWDPLMRLYDYGPAPGKHVWPLLGYFRVVGNILAGGFAPRGQHREDKIVIINAGRADTIDHEPIHVPGVQTRFTWVSNDTVFIASKNGIKGYIRDREFLSFSGLSDITNSIYPVREGVFFGSSDRGLYFIEYKTGKVHHYFDGTCIYAIERDAQGGFWFGTEEHGVMYVPEFQFRNIPFDPKDKIISTIQGGKDHLTVSTKRGNLFRSTMNFHKWEPIALGVISSAKLNLPGYRWALNYTTGPRRPFLCGETVNGEMINKPVPDFYLSVLQTTPGGPTLAADFHSIHIVSHENLEKKQPLMKAVRVQNIVTAGDSSIVFCTTNGILIYNRLKVDTVPLPEGFDQSLIVKDCIRSRDMVVCATHGNGLLAYNIVDDGLKFLKPVKTSGRFFNFIASDNELMLAGCESGLYRLEWENDELTAYNIHFEYGLPPVEVNDAYITDSLIYLATSAGIQSIPASLPPLLKKAVPVRIHAVAVNDSVVADFRSVNAFEHFTGIMGFDIQTRSFRHRNDFVYEYRLLPGDSAWFRTSVPTVQYSSLPPGNYTFQVRTRDNEIYSDEYSFTITPLFWETWWFRATIAVMILLLIGIPIFWMIRENRIRAQHELAFRGLKLSAVSAQMNPHFIFNSLNAIHSFVLQNNSIKSAGYLSRFSMLIRSILDNSMKTLIPLDKSIESIDMYVELEQLRFSDKFEYSKIIDENIPMRDFMVPPMLLQPFVENAILHGIVPKYGKGSLQITLKRLHASLHCIIRDDGIGRKAASEIKDKSGLLHAGQSTSILQERIELFNRLFKTEISLSYTDLSDSSGKPSGTIVNIVIPYYKPFINDPSSHH